MKTFKHVFLVIYIPELFNFLFSPKISCTPFKRFLTHHLFLPQFLRRGAYHDITKPAGSQTSNKSLDNDSMTAEFYKNIYQKTYLRNNLRLRILGNKKVLEKAQIGWRQMLLPSLASRKKILLIAVKITQKQISKFPSPVEFCLISLLSSKYCVQDCRYLSFLGRTCNYGCQFFLSKWKKKTNLGFCAYSNPAGSMWDLCKWSRLEISLNVFRRSSIPQE